MKSSNEAPEKQIQKPKVGLAGAAWPVSVAIMISRILGVGREMVLARYFGAGFFTDAFYVAYRIPNLLRDLFAEGALSSAFLPTFVRRLTQDGKQQAWLLANRVLSVLLVILGILTLVFFFGAKGFVYLLAAGYSADPEKFELTAQMARIMSPFLLCVSFASVGMGLLNACGSFFVPALASSAFNVCCILAGIFLSPFMPHWGLHPVVSMAVGALVGGASQFLVMVPSAYGYGYRFHFALDFKDPGLRHIGKLMLPSIVGLSATQINITVDLQIASAYGDGPVSWLSYAFRLVHLPVGVFGIAIATATMAAVAHHAAQNEYAELHRTVESSLRLAACLTFPAMLGLIIFRHEIIQLLYERGSFLSADTLKTGQALLLYALGLFAYSAVKILVPTLYALNDARTPARLSLLTVAVKIALNLLFILPLGFLGLALATAFSSWLNCCFLVRRVHQHRGLQWSIRDLNAYLRIALASTVMALFAWLVYHVSGLMLSGSSFFILAARLSLSIGFSLMSILPLLRFFMVEEASMLVQMVGNLVRKVL